MRARAKSISSSSLEFLYIYYAHTLERKCPICVYIQLYARTFGAIQALVSCTANNTQICSLNCKSGFLYFPFAGHKWRADALILLQMKIKFYICILKEILRLHSKIVRLPQNPIAISHKVKGDT